MPPIINKCLRCLKFKVPIYPACSGEVKELRDFFKRTGFIKVSKTKQAKKHSEQKVKNSHRFVCLDLRKQVARQIPCSGTVYYCKMSNNTFNFSHFRSL
jgi:hypothetical protein